MAGKLQCPVRVFDGEVEEVSAWNRVLTPNGGVQLVQGDAAQIEHRAFAQWLGETLPTLNHKP